MTTSSGSGGHASAGLDDLLPFYATGKLAAHETRAIEAALLHDAELARKLESVREEMGEVILSNEAICAPSSRAFDALMAGIAAEPKRGAQALEAVKRGIFERLGALISALSPRTLGYATVAFGALIAVQAVVLTGAVNTGAPGGSSYRTASSVESGTFVLVAFAPEARADAVSRVLKAQNASIVEGPRASGLYRVRIGDRALPKEDIARIVSALQADASVISSVTAEN
ncbi:hypothetical protein MCEMSEM23_02678 [Rhabdaerophilaceae bacterium]